jgi:hypothetical protein
MIRRSRLIPRITLQGRRNTEVRNEFNEVTSIVNQTFQVNDVTVQPFIGDMMSPDLNGFQNAEIFTVFTSTPLQTGVEGDTKKADELFIYDGWYRVIKVKRWLSGVIPHYECVCAKLDGGLL